MQCKTVRCNVHCAACLCDRYSTMQRSKVQCASSVCVRYNPRQCGAVCSMPVYQIQCIAERFSVQHACVSDSMQGSKVQCAACMCVRYNARHWGAMCSMSVYQVLYNAMQWGAVYSMPVCQIQCKAVRWSVQHACVSDTMQGSEMKCAACLCVRFNARQWDEVCSMPVCQVQCKAVRCSVHHACFVQYACVSDTMQGSEVQCEACLYARYKARQWGVVCGMHACQIQRNALS